ncbi:MAG: hypothetical protein HC892_09975 [Saprospiraceae bacterium]|nr:hypothetical protein [Saprospiraceae bacterium]
MSSIIQNDTNYLIEELTLVDKQIALEEAAEQKRKLEFENKLKTLFLENYVEENSNLWTKDGFSFNKTVLENLSEEDFNQRIFDINTSIETKKQNKKLEAELKAKQDKEAAEQKAKQEAAEKFKKANDTYKLSTWVDEMNIKKIENANLKPESQKLADEIFGKFQAYKLWAKSQIEKL